MKPLSTDVGESRNPAHAGNNLVEENKKYEEKN